MAKLIVLSLDALGDIDAKYFEQMPGFKHMIESGAYVRRMRSVFPSLTYPCHASILTGRYPKDHGVINNLLLQPSKNKMDWYWYEKDIEGDTLLRAAKRRGLKTATFLWPVSAHGNIDYNVAEIIPHRPWHNQMIVSALNSSMPLLFDLNKRFGHMRNGIEQPQLDEFTEACMLHVLKKYAPDLTMTHYIAVDEFKHRYGTKSEKVVESIRTYDQRIQNVIEYIEQAGEKDYNLVVLSDHSQIDLKIGLRVNVFLRDKGLITTKTPGVVWKYDVIMHEAGGSAYIYSKKKDKRSLEKLRGLLEEFQKEYGGIRRIYTGEEAADLGADPECSFLLDAESGWYFLQDMNGEIIEPNYPKHVATHGYGPDRPDYSAVFFGLGPAFRHGVLEDARLIDIAPTLSRIMQLRLQGASGRVLTEILNI